MAMLPDKEVKKKFKLEASANPDKYYPTRILNAEGFERKRCKCGTRFWTVNKSQDHCGDPQCSGGFQVVNNNPSKHKLTYPQVWEKIVEMLGPKGYKPVNRYPVVARWNPTADFVMASIAAFQPYVVTGEVKPPAKKLIIPQFSLRFGDVDNVGITGSHLTGFVMIGQHVFVEKEEWDQEQLFKDIYEFLTIGIGLPKSEITIHEDAWAGGGSYGPCMEFFSRGVELFNQVYTMFEQTPEGDRELKLKVLDMGLGMERIAWFSQGTPNIYESTFPEVLKRLRVITDIQMDFDLYKRFSAFSAYLNVDEVENIEEAWQDVAQKLGLSVKDLKSKIVPMTALYSIAEHTRTLLVALNDGALPSNVGGGYNLRVIFRRAQAFIDQFNWEIDMAEVAAWHAEELKKLFPELSEHLVDVKKILDVEKKKYTASKDKAKALVQKIIQNDITKDTLLELYDSQGINPEVIREEAGKLGKIVVVPENFYALVSELHEKREQIHATHRELSIDFPDREETEVLYWDNHALMTFTAVVKFIAGDSDQYIVLDQTAFYPTSGGQMHDTGKINGYDVVDVIKHGKVIVHVVPKHGLKVGDQVRGMIDAAERMQLTIHHTATHVINAAAKAVLGNHINQIGAKKTLERASLDITHYESLSEDELKKIEAEANRIVKNHYNIRKFFLPRDDAERRFGMSIYQGGAIPGNNLRMVIIGEGKDDKKVVDVECCAGTHLDNSGQIGSIKVLKSTKISDGVVRLVYVAGDRANVASNQNVDLSKTISDRLGCKIEQIPGRCQELFSKWKNAAKLKKKEQELPDDIFSLTSQEIFDGEPLKEAARILNTQPEHILNTINKFMQDLDKYRK